MENFYKISIIIFTTFIIIYITLILLLNSLFAQLERQSKSTQTTTRNFLLHEVPLSAPIRIHFPSEVPVEITTSSSIPRKNGEQKTVNSCNCTSGATKQIADMTLGYGTPSRQHRHRIHRLHLQHRNKTRRTNYEKKYLSKNSEGSVKTTFQQKLSAKVKNAFDRVIRFSHPHLSPKWRINIRKWVRKNNIS